LGKILFGRIAKPMANSLLQHPKGTLQNFILLPSKRVTLKVAAALVPQ
jgi:hypothetical protein